MTDAVDHDQAGAALFALPCQFAISASVPEHFPEGAGALPEVAFWGRSNVGKSSLINAITGQKGLARASNTPGRTQQIIFFNLSDRLMLVDLPGYGHANAPKDVIAQWTGLIHRYLKTRTRLYCLCLLIDARRGVMPVDQEMMALLDKHAISFQLILTKSDTVKPAARAALIENTEKILKKHPAARPQVLLTSAEEKEGLGPVRAALSPYAIQN